ncbi:MAG TPA: peptide chain release factor N(5)-glutamine methyltransferase [Pyrinomonadaceae bacterium]|jgi:release factor glutamine methyltransferase
MRIDEALRDAARRLDVAGVTDPRREAASLLAFALQKPLAFLIAHPEHHLADEQQMMFTEFVARRETREPFQYITRKQEFWGLEFAVARGVLIPRPETELLVEAALEHLRKRENAIFVEAGVGSGCISISMLHSLPNARAVATDISSIALDTAQKNASRHGVDDRLELRSADLLSGLTGEFGLIVTNPPYIPDAGIAGLQPEVRDFEPREALAGGADGLDLIRRLVIEAGHILRPGGVLMMEIGAGQATAVAELFDPDKWGSPEFQNDLQAIPRVVIARRR